jgi:enoyl-CoA hydratase/carnithine racemase
MSSENNEPIKFTMLEKRVALVTFNRPHVRNAFNFPTLQKLDALVDEIAQNEKVRVVMFRGEGGHFSTGNDLKAAMSPDEINAAQRLGRNLCLKIMYLPQISIAAIEGYALGGGFEIALAADLRIASATAKMGLPELQFGYPIAWGGWNLLGHLVSLPIAKQIVLLGEQFSPNQAQAWGLVAKVYEESEFESKLMEHVKKLQSLNPELIHLSRLALNQAIESPLSNTTCLADEVFEINYSLDRKERTRTFRERLSKKYFT